MESFRLSSILCTLDFGQLSGMKGGEPWARGGCKKRIFILYVIYVSTFYIPIAVVNEERSDWKFYGTFFCKIMPTGWHKIKSKISMELNGEFPKGIRKT